MGWDAVEGSTALLARAEAGLGTEGGSSCCVLSSFDVASAERVPGICRADRSSGLENFACATTLVALPLPMISEQRSFFAHCYVSGRPESPDDVCVLRLDTLNTDIGNT